MNTNDVIETLDRIEAAYWPTDESFYEQGLSGDPAVIVANSRLRRAHEHILLARMHLREVENAQNHE